MEHTAEDQRMYRCFGSFHPMKEIVHQLGNELGRRCHEDTPITVKDTFFPTAEIAGLLHDIFRHDTVKGLQITDAVWVDLPYPLIGGVSILDLLDLFLLTQNGLAVDNIPHLSQRKGVCFDPQGCVDGFDSVVLPQVGFCLHMNRGGNTPHLFGNGRYICQDLVCNGKGWSVILQENTSIILRIILRTIYLYYTLFPPKINQKNIRQTYRGNSVRSELPLNHIDLRIILDNIRYITI